MGNRLLNGKHGHQHQHNSKQFQIGNEETFDSTDSAINTISSNTNANVNTNTNTNANSSQNESKLFQKSKKSTAKPVKKYEITFKWNEGGKSVCISGSFCKWKQMIALEKSSDGASFEIRLNLPIGIYQYKYLVDDKWLFSNEDPICTDENGNINNIIDINLIALKSKFSTDLKLFNYFELLTTSNLPSEYLSHSVFSFIYNFYIENTLKNNKQPLIPRVKTGSVHHLALIDSNRYYDSDYCDSDDNKEEDSDKMVKKKKSDVMVIKLGVSCRYRQKLSLFVYYKPIKNNIGNKS